jgi:nucleoside-diphosphate-sugar epimerase
MKKTVLITGAAGFIGSHLCDYFLSKKLQGNRYR